MSVKDLKARLTQGFLDRVAATGLTDEATARAIGVSKQFYSEVKRGRQNPTIGFMAGAINAGYASNFAEVAEPIPTNESEQVPA